MHRCRTTKPIILVSLAMLSAASVWAQESIPVRTVAPLQQTISEQRELSGSLITRRSAALSPRESGVVAELLVDVGDSVVSGQPLLRLDATLVKLQAAREQAAVDEAQVRLEEAQRVSTESAALADQRNIARTQARAAAAEARVQAAAAASARANADLVAERVRRHTLKAPFAGVITARHVDLGEWTDASAAAFDLIDIGSLSFDVQAPQELHGRIQTGETAVLRIDALGPTPIEAKVAAVVPVKDPTARTFLVRLTPESSATGLAPGMSGRVKFALDRGGLAWTLPRDALVRYPDGSHGVWIIERTADGSTARAQQVQLGIEVNGQVEIRSGISGGEQVVDRGNERLRDGAVVRVL